MSSRSIGVRGVPSSGVAASREKHQIHTPPYTHTHTHAPATDTHSTSTGLSDEDDEDQQRAPTRAYPRSRRTVSGASEAHHRQQPSSTSTASMQPPPSTGQTAGEEDEVDILDYDAPDDDDGHSRDDDDDNDRDLSSSGDVDDGDSGFRSGKSASLRASIHPSMSAASSTATFASATTIGTASTRTNGGRLSDEQQEEYVRKSFPTLIIGADPYSNLAHTRKQPRASPHIVTLAGMDRSRRVGGGAVGPAGSGTGRDSDSGSADRPTGSDAALPLYLSKDPSLDPSLSATGGLILPPLPRSGAGAGPSPAFDGPAAPLNPMQPAKSLKQRRREAGMEKARLAIEVAHQMERERSTGPLGHFAFHTKSSRVHGGGSVTERRRSRSPIRASLGSHTSRARTIQASVSFGGSSSTATLSSDGGVGGVAGVDEECKTFLTESSPFHMPKSLDSAVRPATYAGMVAGPAEVPVNPRGSWVGPVGADAGAYIRLVNSQLEFNRWTEVLIQHCQRIFQAKWKDLNMSIAPSLVGVSGGGAGGGDRRQRKWCSDLLRGVRQGQLKLASNGLAENAIPEVCRLLAQRLVPIEVLHPTTPVHFVHVDLANNQLADEGIATLAEAITQTHNQTPQQGQIAIPAPPTPNIFNELRVIDLSSNRISSHGLSKICHALCKAPALTSVDFSSSSSSGLKNANYIGPGVRGAQGLRHLLDRSRTLRRLSLVNIGLGLVHGAMKEIAEGISASRTIQYIDLAQNGLGPEDALLLTESLARAPHPTLQTLILKRNQLGSLGCARFGHHLKHHHSLTRVDLSFNEIGLIGWLLLTDGIHHNPSIDRIILDGNFFSAKPTAAIAGERRICKTISEETILFLTNAIRIAHLRDQSCSPRLGSNHSLRTLSLRQCGLSDHFVCKLMDSLSKHTTLTSLSLSSNALRQDSAESIATFLAKNPPLKMIDISENDINDQGGAAITRALKENTHLTDLRVDKNDLGESTGEGMLRLLEHNPTLTSIHVEGNKIPYRLFRSISDTSSKHADHWSQGSFGRLQAEVARLRIGELKLRKIDRQVVDACLLADHLSSELTQLDHHHTAFFDHERALTFNLKLESDAVVEAHRALVQEEFTLDMDLKKKRGELDATLEVKRKERDAHKDARMASEKQIARSRETLATFHKESSLDFDEGDRLAIVIQSHEKRNKATAHLISEDVNRLAEWIKALQAKLERGEANPYANANANGGSSDGSLAPQPHPPSTADRKKRALALPSPASSTPNPPSGGRQRQRKGSLATSHLLPRTLDGAPIMPAKLTSMLERMREDDDEDADEEEESSLVNSAPAPAPVASIKPLAPSTARKSSSSLANSSRGGRTVSGAGTLLRPAPTIPVEPAKNAILWSQQEGGGPTPPTGEKKTARKRKTHTKKKAAVTSNPESNSTAPAPLASPAGSPRGSEYTDSAYSGYTPQATGGSVANAPDTQPSIAIDTPR